MNAKIEPTLKNRMIVCLTADNKYIVFDMPTYFDEIEKALTFNQPHTWFPLFFCNNNEYGLRTYVIKYIESAVKKYQIFRAKSMTDVTEYFVEKNPTVVEKWITDITEQFSQ